MIRAAPRIPLSEYQKRRRRLLKSMAPDSAALVIAAPHRVRNRDTEYPYRQDSDFHYLTGFAEPESVAVFVPKRKEGEYVLFCRERDPAAEVWSGRRAGPQGAVDRFAADQAFAVSQIDEVLPQLLENKRRLYYTVGREAEQDGRIMSWVNTVRARVRAGVSAPTEFVSLESVLYEMRLRKSAAEATVMRHAAAIAAAAHTRAMRICRPGMMEWEVEAEILHEFRRSGAVPGYNTIVGGGENACILHYVENSAELRDGDLLLIDAGAEWDSYASDITRTFPVNGRFTEAQREIYQLVLAAQRSAMAQVRPGRRWNAPHDAAVRALTRGLIALGLLRGDPAELIQNGAYRRFYMHRTGHWLGMDVHDVGEYRVDGKWRALEPGMVLTVEPGLYISPSKDVPERYWNIGVRIEDDVLVTEDGSDVLTDGVPKSTADIERLMAKSSSGRRDAKHG